MKFLLVISKNYWGADKSEETAFKFLNSFSKFADIKAQNIKTLIGNEVNVSSVKKTLYDFIYSNYQINSLGHFYIYINGHGNQIQDTNNDEKIIVLSEDETTKDHLDEIYQLPDGHLVDDEITNILTNAIKNKQSSLLSENYTKPFIFLISDHCSSGSMIDNLPDNDSLFNWITIGSSLDNQDSLMTGDGNVMTINFLNLLSKINNDVSAVEFNSMLQKEMKESFVGDLQTATFHISNKDMLEYKLFKAQS